MNQKLDEAMQALAAENATIAVPPELQAKVMAEFDARHAPRAWARWWFPGVALALAALFVAAAFLWRRPTPVQPPMEARFVAIPYVAPPAPYERTEVKRMDVPLAALIAAGLEVRTISAAGTVRADVLVGQDGRPLAIRLVQNKI